MITDPVPTLKAIGTNQSEATSAVIITGLRRVRAPFRGYPDRLRQIEPSGPRLRLFGAGGIGKVDAAESTPTMIRDRIAVSRKAVPYQSCPGFSGGEISTARSAGTGIG